MRQPRYLTALALSPTREKDLVDRQRAVLARWSLPAALALPPVMPLLSGKKPPEENLFQELRRTAWKTAPFGDYRIAGGILLVPADFSASPPPVGRTGSLEGFYIADLKGTSALPPEESVIGSLPPPPGGLIRTLRLQILEVFCSSPPEPWWHQVRWEVLREEWIKLLP